MILYNIGVDEITSYLKNTKYKKILIITGNNSYFKSGASAIFKKIINNKITHFYFKNSYFPEIKELKKIVKLSDKIKTDLILAIGGGAVIDYAKIVSCTEYKEITFKKIFRKSKL